MFMLLLFKYMYKARLISNKDLFIVIDILHIITI